MTKHPKHEHDDPHTPEATPVTAPDHPRVAPRAVAMVERVPEAPACGCGALAQRIVKEGGKPDVLMCVECAYPFAHKTTKRSVVAMVPKK